MKVVQDISSTNWDTTIQCQMLVRNLEIKKKKYQPDFDSSRIFLNAKYLHDLIGEKKTYYNSSWIV